MRAVLLVLLLLASCGDAPAPVEPAGPPQRIVSTLPGITEMVAYLGALDRLVAVSPYCDFPREVKDLPRIKVHPFDVEAVMRVRPDLVIVDHRMHRRDLALIRKRVRNVLELDTSRSHLSVWGAMERIVHVLDTDQARERLESWRNEMRSLWDRMAEDAKRRPFIRPRVLIVGQWDPLYVLGKGSLIDDLVARCGGDNVAWDLEGDASGTFSEELVLERKPDLILTPRTPMPERIRKRWTALPAVRNGRIVDGSGDDLVRAGPRIIQGLARLVRIVRAEARK